MTRIPTEKAKRKFEEDFAFYEELHFFYTHNRKKIRSRYNSLTKKFLDYNDRAKRPEAFLRPPQFEALEMYVFMKEFLGNKTIADIFDEWRKHEGVFAPDSSYSYSRSHGGQLSLFEMATEKQTEALFASMEKYRESYPNYIYALTMGLGKTILMAACIFYEFLLAKKYPKDKSFVHNALVFAPDKTVLESLREIVEFDKTLVVPKEYVPWLNQNMRFHFLDDSGATLNTLDDSSFNVIISNTQKIIVRKKRREEKPAQALFASSLLAGFRAGDTDDVVIDEAGLMENQRFQRLTRLPNLGVYVDEAHHLFGAALEKGLREKGETSLRATINRLAKKTCLVACYNYTGTPYVKRRPLPEVVYSYGLQQSINKGYLKSARLKSYTNVKSADFLGDVIADFWKCYGGKTYEGLTPKLAIFAATIEEAVEEVRPAVEEALAKIGVDSSIVLVNVGDSKYTKDEDIRLFNQLDVPESAGNTKQIIILVGKGREGWNCRSLFGVAMFRSPKSKVFVLQATMRCLRSITDIQQEATVYLSEENYRILDDEMEQNFHMDVDGLTKTDKKEKHEYLVRVRPPEQTIAVKRVRREYGLAQRTWDGAAINFTLPAEGELEEKYGSRITEKKLTAQGLGEKRALETVGGKHYTRFMLVGELARYFGGIGVGDVDAIGALEISCMLDNVVGGVEIVLDVVNRYPQVIDDYLVPAIFNTFYEVTATESTREEELVLLHTPEGKEGYIFHAEPKLVAKAIPGEEFTEEDMEKSFHADTYCFDSLPELQLFKDCLEADSVERVYFTGMFTSGQGDLAIPWFDKESGMLRNYYPDFVAHMADGTIELVEVKGAHKVDDPDVQAKAQAARDLTDGEKILYRLISDEEIKNGVWPGGKPSQGYLEVE